MTDEERPYPCTCGECVGARPDEPPPKDEERVDWSKHQACGALIRQAREDREQLQARVAVLEGALRDIRDFHEHTEDVECFYCVVLARAALSAPAHEEETKCDCGLALEQHKTFCATRTGERD